jgi:putative ABC transport system substrate-binding protein
MRRREFIRAIGLTAAWPLAARAQQKPMPVIGYVSVAPIKFADRALVGFRQGLAEYGYVEGQNVRFELRDANFQTDLLPVLYRELVNQKVSVIIVDWTAKLEAARSATQSIPIVFEIAVDPVKNGFVASFNKPGGNIIGTYVIGELAAKRLEVLHELLPTVKTFACLFDPTDTTAAKLALQVIQAAADSLGLGLLTVNAHALDEFEVAFDTAVRGGAGGMLLSGSIYANASPQLVPVAARYRLPVVYGDDRLVKAGGLISYAADHDEAYRVVGRYTGRILKGEKPADLPVEQSTKVKLVINLKTAKTLGITVPLSLLGRAHEVIERGGESSLLSR